MKRAFSLLLVLVMSAALLSSCGNASEGTTTSTTESTTQQSQGSQENQSNEGEKEEIPTETQQPMSFEGKNLGGYTFVVADVDSNRWTPQAGSSDHANAVLARNKWVEDTLGVKIEYRPHNEAELQAAILSGDKYADIVITYMWEVARHAQAKRLADMSQLKEVNFEADYWTDFNVVNYLKFGNRILGTSASFASQTDQIWACFFNKKIIEELGLENPYDLVANNQWTFDKFLEMQKAAFLDNGDGVPGPEDRYGFAVGHDWDASVVMFLASGNEIAGTKSDGSRFFNINNANSFNAIDQLKNILKRGETFYPKPDGSGMDTYIKAFTEGKVLFLAYSFGDSTMAPVYQMDDDFGIVPLPMGDQATDYKCWVSHNAPTIGVPITNQDLDKTALVMEALAYKAYPEEENFFEEISLTKLRDDESLDTLLNLKKWGTSDFMFMGQQAAGGCYAALNLIVSTAFYNQDTLEPVSEAAAIEQQVNLALEEANSRFMGTYIEPEPTEEELAGETEGEAEGETE